MFQELARALARSVLRESDNSEAEIGLRLFRRLLTRVPSRREMDLLLQFRKKQLARLHDGALRADEIGARDGTTAELASWIIVARAVMNLDEALTKQ
ncbi:MAG: hypothetical protein ABGZ17_17290, partial [Planctomycetaceae bacterium]